jgi:predicted DsbA family dithiol-disulfide isomerase
LHLLVKVEIWSDVVCPWCYIGKRRMEQALSQFEHGDQVEVVWRSFELDRSAPPERGGDYASRLADKYGVSLPEAQAMIDRMTTAAAGEGLVFRFDLARPGNTFDAHRLIHLGAVRGIQDQVKERLLEATFAEGQPIGDRRTLVGLAVEVGLDEGEARAVIEGDAYAEAVRADERDAAELGITGVPYFVVDRAYGVSGAQPPEVLVEVLQRAWADRHASLTVTGGKDAPSCPGDACAV